MDGWECHLENGLEVTIGGILRAPAITSSAGRAAVTIFFSLLPPFSFLNQFFFSFSLFLFFFFSSFLFGLKRSVCSHGLIWS